MFAVCEKYLCQYPGDTGLLWEVEGIGGPNQRTNVASRIQAMEQSGKKAQKRHCRVGHFKRLDTIKIIFSIILKLFV